MKTFFQKSIICVFAVCATAVAMGQSAPDVIEFAMISDTHAYGPSADQRYASGNIKAFVKYCQETPNLSFALHGGDLMNAYNTNHEQALWCLERARRDFEGLRIPMYVTKGNHDCNGKQRKPDGRYDNSQIVTDHEFYQLYSPLSPSNPLATPEGIVNDPVNPEGNYYYRDFDQQHFRLIVLNGYDRDSLELFGYHGQQVKWLAETALNFEQKKEPEKWCYLIFCHSFSENLKDHPTTRLMQAYVNGQLFSDTDNGVSYGGSYHKMRRGTAITLLGGHHHEDIFRQGANLNMISISRGFALGGELGNPNEEICFDHFVLNTRERTLVEHRIGRGRDRKYVFGQQHTMVSPQGAFPEADGLGIYTQGGRGGRIYHVTNLNDAGPGSLREGVGQQGARQIVFDVSGVIQLKSPLEIQNDSISVLGHSAPGMGITLTGAPVRVLASEVILRYIRLRGCGISDGDFGQHHLMFDHLSVNCTMGSCIDIRRAQGVTVQYCILSHSLSKASESNPAAALVAGGFMSTYHHNLIANHVRAIFFPNEEGQNRWIHVARNLIYNWKDYAMFGGGRHGEITIEENYLIPGAATKNMQMLDVAEDGTGRYYVWGNEVKGREEYTMWNRQLVNDRVGLPYDPEEYDVNERQRMNPVQRPEVGNFANSCLSIAAFHYKPFFNQPTKRQLYRECMMDVGASLKRDSYDEELPKYFGRNESYGSSDGLISAMTSVGGIPKIRTENHQPEVDHLEEWLNNRVKREKSIVILYENQPLCTIEGYPKLAGTRDAISPDTAYVGIVSTGDFLNGTLFGTMNRGKYIVEIIKHAQYDALTLGNHDFDLKIDEMQKTLSPIRDLITCCNLHRIEDQKNVFVPYILRQYGGRKVAFVGVTTPYSFRTRQSAFLDASRQQIYTLIPDEELYAQVQLQVDCARRDGADYVIVLSHLGEGRDGALNSRDLIATTSGIDVVLDGHQSGEGVAGVHVFNKDGKPVPYSWAGDRFKNVGKLIIAPDGLITTELIPIESQKFNNPATTFMLDSIQSLYQEYVSELAGVSEVDILRTDLRSGLSIREGETTAGDLVSDALREFTNADVAIINAGAFRHDFYKGPVTRGLISEMLPFYDMIEKLKVKGSTIRHLLYEMATHLPSTEWHLVQPSGMRYSYSEGRGVSNIEILDRKSGQYKPLAPDEEYTVGTIDYCLYEAIYRETFAEAEVVSTYNATIAEALFDYIQKTLNGRISDAYAAPQGRVTLIRP